MKKGTDVLLIVVFVVVIGIWILLIELKSGKNIHIKKEEIAVITEKEKIEILGIKNLTADGKPI